MKKIALTIAIVLGFGLSVFAQQPDRGLFQRGELQPDEYYYNYDYNYNSLWFAMDQNLYGGGLFSFLRSGMLPDLPGHNQDTNQPAVPIGSGTLLLLGFGAAYAMKKNRKK